jgi:hypothetical protein
VEQGKIILMKEVKKQAALEKQDKLKSLGLFPVCFKISEQYH